jgi:hypothetical protein
MRSNSEASFSRLFYYKKSIITIVLQIKDGGIV